MRPVPPQRHAGPARLLRYRFDTAHQIAHHFHASSGRAVLFYPARVHLCPGEPVVLDVAFTASDQHCAVRGSVLGCEVGGQYGSWLEFGGSGVVADLQRASIARRRRHRRFLTGKVLHVGCGEQPPVMARLVDVSLGGARLAGATFAARPGESVRLSALSTSAGATVIAARMAWRRDGEAGVEFKRLSPAERAGVAALVEEARGHLGAAHEAVHPSVCRCAQGDATFEPPLPRVLHRPAALR